MVISKKLLCCAFIALTLFGSLVAKSKKKSKSGFKSASPATTAAEVSGENGEVSEEEIKDENPDAAWQYLEWIEDYPEYVMKYEVVIEEKKNDNQENLVSGHDNPSCEKCSMCEQILQFFRAKSRSLSAERLTLGQKTLQ